MTRTLMTVLAAAIAASTAMAAPTDDEAPEILTVKRNGEFSNTNVVGNIEAFAAAKAQDEFTAQVAEMAHQVSTNVEQIVRDGIAELQRGRKIEYSNLYHWQEGTVALSTNTACCIFDVKLDNSRTKTIDGVVCFAVDIHYYFTEDLRDYDPSVLYKTTLNGTNDWTRCTQDDPVGPYTTNITASVTVDNAFMTRCWLPKTLATAFFKAFVDSSAPGTAATLDIVGRIKGGFTGSLVFQLANGHWLWIDVDGGVVTRIEENEEAP